MIIVGGHITVAPEERENYLASCVEIVEQARIASGCLDMSISADLVDPGRITIFERWESQAQLDAFRSGGPAPEQHAAMLSVAVEEYDVAEARPLFGEPAS